MSPPFKCQIFRKLEQADQSSLQPGVVLFKTRPATSSRVCDCRVEDEQEPGAAYLAALRRSIAPAEKPPEEIHHQAHSKEASSSQAGTGHSERRKSPRHSCNGSVRLQETAGGTSSWAPFTDISMHGCYIESTAPYSVGTVLDLKLEVEGFRIEAVGEVRVAYPGLGMGVSFNRISELDRARLRELLAAFSPRSRLVAGQAQNSFRTQEPAKSESNIPPVANPSAALQAITQFFESRHMMGREEFLRILRDSH
jgi:hypothetical protein